MTDIQIISSGENFKVVPGTMSIKGRDFHHWYQGSWNPAWGSLHRDIIEDYTDLATERGLSVTIDGDSRW